jgi:hypothetical protein
MQVPSPPAIQPVDRALAVAVWPLLTSNSLDAKGGDGASWRRLLLQGPVAPPGCTPRASGEASALARW